MKYVAIYLPVAIVVLFGLVVLYGSKNAECDGETK